MRLLVVPLVLLVLAGCASAYRTITAPTPEEARIVTDDLARFYAVFDALPGGVSDEEAARYFEAGYFEPGSPGLRAFRERTGETLVFARAVLARRRFFSSIRETVLTRAADPTLADSVRAAYRALEAVYPEARFPDVYLLVGRLQTGGTLARPGLLVGAEHFALGPGVPRGELSAWQQTAVFPPEGLLPLIVHELMHAQQARRRPPRTRLREALAEGCPDYLTERLVGRHPNSAEEAWARPREEALWREFSAGLRSEDLGDWFYRKPLRSSEPDRPKDLGYVLGAWICEAYVENAPDEEAALREVIRLDDPERVFRESGYAARFEP